MRRTAVRAGLVVLATIGCAVLLGVTPARAGVSGGGTTGALIVNTVYNTVVKQNVTDVTRTELNATLSHIVGSGSVEIGHPDGTSSSQQFSAQATVDASATASGLTDMLTTLNGDVFGVPGATSAYKLDGTAIPGESRQDIQEHLAELDRQGKLQPLLQSGFQGSHTVSLAPVVSEQLTSTDTSNATTVTYTETPGAIVIGDPSCLSCDLNGTTFVVQGTVTVTDTETTIETQNITRTTTTPYNTINEYTMSVDRLISAEDQCKDGGWQQLTDNQGHPFRNQDDCVNYAATGGRNPADGEHTNGDHNNNNNGEHNHNGDHSHSNSSRHDNGNTSSD